MKVGGGKDCSQDPKLTGVGEINKKNRYPWFFLDILGSTINHLHVNQSQAYGTAAPRAMAGGKRRRAPAGNF